MLFLCAVQLQHLVEVILVHACGVCGVCGVAYLLLLQVGVSRLWQCGLMVVAHRVWFLKKWSMEGFEQADVGCVVVGSDSSHLTRVTSDGIS